MTRTETITISAGNQYDKGGYSIESDTGLSAYGSIANRMDGTTGVTLEGRWTLGYDWERTGYTMAQIEDAIMATLVSGQDTVIVLTREIADAPARTSNRGVCPRCHTYCYGDCRA